MELKVFFKKLWNLIREFFAVVKFLQENRSGKSYGKKITLFWLYLKIVFKDCLLVRLLRFQIKQERFLGLTVHFKNYSAFKFLFVEIFLKEEYYFTSEKSDPCIIDCGANIGMAIFFFKFFYPASKIIAFEPDQESFTFLKENIENNQFKDVVIHNLAVSDKEGEVIFYSDTINPFLKTTIRGAIIPEKLSMSKVLTAPLSGFINGPIDLLKIDIEGSEDIVILELAQTNKLMQVEEMIIEYHPDIVTKLKPLHQFVLFLKDNHFHCTTLGTKGQLASMVYARK